MFGIKKIAAQPTGANRASALKLIEAEIKVMEELKDGKSQEAYIVGLAEMALTLGAITLEERMEIATRAHAKAQEVKAKGEPVYKKKGVYEYNGYNILKDFEKEAGAGSACWYVKEIGKSKIIAHDLKFKDAVKVIDDNN